MTTASVQSSHSDSQVTAKVGSEIYFKSDIEQSAIIKEIRQGSRRAPIQIRVDVTRGEYRGSNQWLDLADCWN